MASATNEPHLEQLFHDQDRVITRIQALEVLTESALRHKLATQWSIVHPGVYLGATGDPSPRQRLRAALLYAGRDSQFGDQTALCRYGVRYLPNDDTIHLLLPASVRRANRDGVVVRRTHRLSPPRYLDGFPYSSPERALVEFAARTGDRRTAVAVFADAVQRKIARPERLMQEAGHVTGRGAAVVRDALNSIVVGARSAPEADLLTLFRSSRILPEPLVNPLLELPAGQLVSPDFFFEDAALAHEVNGREHHAGQDLFEAMQARHDLMTVAGLTVLHSTPGQGRREPYRILRETEECYLSLAGRGLPPGVTILRRSADGPRLTR